MQDGSERVIQKTSGKGGIRMSAMGIDVLSPRLANISMNDNEGNDVSHFGNAVRIRSHLSIWQGSEEGA